MTAKQLCLQMDYRNAPGNKRGLRQMNTNVHLP
ncbi:hypothetical protein MALU111345_03880 [Marinicrinis lubricantis]